MLVNSCPACVASDGRYHAAANLVSKLFPDPFAILTVREPKKGKDKKSGIKGRKGRKRLSLLLGLLFGLGLLRGTLGLGAILGLDILIVDGHSLVDLGLESGLILETIDKGLVKDQGRICS